jgi:undecaprenyl-diphosphatase
MDILQAVILGIIQGITEWLPISSSGHLALAQNFLGIAPPLFFDVLLHFGTILVILAVFRREILYTARNPQKLILVLLAVIPIIITGAIFRDQIASLFAKPLLVAILLITNGGILILTQLFRHQTSSINIRKAFVMGLFQALAILPGISRSGATISAALFQGVRRAEAVCFSFIIAIIPIIGATVFEFSMLRTVVNPWPFIIGTIVSMILGYFSLKWLITLVKKQQLHIFGYYCIALGLVVLIVMR